MRRDRSVAWTMSEEPEACLRCGANDWQTVRPSFWSAVRDWSRSGRDFRAELRVCRRCGLEMPGGAVAYLAAATPGWWTAPARMLKVLRRRRTMQPFPQTYALAAGAGLILAFLLQILLGWAWWVVLPGFLLLVWLFFLSTAFWHRTEDPRDLATELLGVISPGRALARRRRRTEELLRRAPFALYGLPASWGESRLIGGYGTSNGKLTSLELLHGDPSAAAGPYLGAESSVVVPGHRDLRSYQMELWREASRRQLDVPPERLPGAVNRLEEALRARAADWKKVSIPVDGAPLEFEWLEEGSAWVAVREGPDVTVKVRGGNFPLEWVRLVTIRDLQPYLDGAEAQGAAF